MNPAILANAATNTGATSLGGTAATEMNKKKWKKCYYNLHLQDLRISPLKAPIPLGPPHPLPPFLACNNGREQGLCV